MQSITFSHAGDPLSVLSLTTQPIPTLKPDQVLIKVKLEPIQQADF